MASKSGGMSRREFLRQAAAGAAAAAAVSAGVGLTPGAMAAGASAGAAADGGAVALPSGVKAVWDLGKAFRQKTATREQVCVNGLWRWQPASVGESGKVAADQVPGDGWGYYKVPGDWPGLSDYMHKETQTLYRHPSWKDEKLGEVTGAWYQRDLTVPSDWTGRRVVLHAEVVNSYAAVYIDGKKAGEILFPAGDADLTAVCQPGQTYRLTLLVVAMPLRGVMLSYNDTASAREVRGSVERRGLCGDVFLVGTPPAARVEFVRVDTSVRKGELTVGADLAGLAANATYTLRAEVREGDRVVHAFTGAPFGSADLTRGRRTLTDQWVAGKLWDLHTPENTYQLSLQLLDAAGQVVDAALPVRFGYREFWIDGKDFYLNGTRLYLSSVPVDNAGVSAQASTYEGACESFRRLKSIGINYVYGHNYGCEPGSHLSFEDALRAADDVGMLVGLSQPHFGHYEWEAADADRTNGYARHAAYYVRVAGSHPSTVFYVMSHNGTGYAEDMNPDLIDGINAPREQWGERNSRRALRAESIVAAMDSARIIYHHSSGNLGALHNTNFYPNMIPAQELSDWLEHWSTVGMKPFFTCEYAAPMTWDWTMYRGWYKGERAFGSGVVPWEFCQAEWSAQFLGDRSFRLTEPEKVNLRWEANQFREGKLWYRWDYPYQVGNKTFDDQHAIVARYTEDNWRAFRTWGMSANSPWDHSFFWRLPQGFTRKRVDLPVDWDSLQRPGLSPDFLNDQYERIDMSYAVSDWEPTADAKALLRNNQPLLAYIGGKAPRFTSKDHNFTAGEKVEKQLILINNSRLPLRCDWEWSLALPQPITGRGTARVPTGNQERIAITAVLPAGLAAGAYELTATARFSNGETQHDAFAVHVLPRPARPKAPTSLAVFDPKGETTALLRALGIAFTPVAANADLSSYPVLVIGRGALTVDGPAPDLSRVRQGLKVIVFEQTSEALEKRLGFRVTEYGLRQAFARVPDHPLLTGLEAEHLRDWRGDATLLSPRLKYTKDGDVFNGVPVVKWCDIPVTRVWRCGNRGNVASVLIEKPAHGSFLPLVEGGYGLQYSPLLEYREGKGMVLFCQMDVTGRSEADPAADTLARRLLSYAAKWQPASMRRARYVGDPAGRRYLEAMGLTLPTYNGTLSADEVLIVGPGGDAEMAPHAGAISTWLKSGGHVLAIGLEGAGASRFLPFRVSTKHEEHIATWFAPAPANSPFAGVSPGDLASRDPRAVNLVSGGATVVGNGALAVGDHTGVVFSALVPWEFDWQKQMNLKRTFRRLSVLTARLLGNMGVAGATPLLARFKQPVAVAKPEPRWSQGLYLDQPEEWDDPYRFFRW